MNERSIAFYMAFVGGILQVIASAALVLVAPNGDPMKSYYVISASALGSNAQLMGGIGLVFGLLVLAGAILSVRTPYGGNRKTLIGSALVVIFSFLSIFLSGGGFIIGFILGLLGGVLGYVSSKPDYSGG